MVDIKGKFPNGLAAAMARKDIGPTALARLAGGTSKQNLVRYRDQERKLPPELARVLAPLLDTTPGDLIFDGGGAEVADLPGESTIAPPEPTPQGGARLRALPPRAPDGDMPLYRFAHAGRGNLILEEIPFESVTRPDYLARVREPYGVMVDGDSMIPEFHAGWIAEVNPNLVPRKDDTCVFRGEAVDGGFWAALKVYVREDETHWHVRQHNPRKSYKLKKSEFQSAHVVVGTDRRRR